jgi:hypothetical protein
VKVNAWLVWRKLTAPSADQFESELPTALPHEAEMLFARGNLAGNKILWAAPCVSVASREVPGNVFGHLVATVEEPRKLRFVAHRRWRPVAVELDLATYKAAQESKFLSENVVLYSLEKKPKYLFVFDRSQRAIARQIAKSLQTRLTQPVAATGTIAQTA